MKTICMVLLIAVSGCVEFDCYSNLSYAIEQADNFCRAGKSDKELCEVLKFEGKDNICEGNPPEN